MRLWHGSRFVRFLVTGGLAALINLIARAVLSRYVLYELAVAVAYLIGMTAAFVLAKLFVFDASGRAMRDEYVRFAIVNAVAFVQVWIVSVGLARFVFPAIGVTWHGETLAHLIGVGSPIVTSYYGHKLFTFRSPGAESRGDRT